MRTTPKPFSVVEKDGKFFLKITSQQHGSRVLEAGFPDEAMANAAIIFMQAGYDLGYAEGGVRAMDEALAMIQAGPVVLNA